MHAHQISPLVSILIGLSAVATNANDIQDDFSRDSGLWHFSGGGGKGKHVLQNNRLEFSTQETFTGNDSATHYWKVPIGSYDESWEVQADVFLGNFQLGNGNPYAGLALLVGNKSKPSRSFIRVQLRRVTKVIVLSMRTLMRAEIISVQSGRTQLPIQQQSEFSLMLNRSS
jgi:hypothetical protein